MDLIGGTHLPVVPVRPWPETVPQALGPRGFAARTDGLASRARSSHAPCGFRWEDLSHCSRPQKPQRRAQGVDQRGDVRETKEVGEKGTDWRKEQVNFKPSLLEIRVAICS